MHIVGYQNLLFHFSSVLSSDKLFVSMENTVFLALMRWAEVNDTYGEVLEPLLELVRFKAMTINYLHDIVTSNHPIAATVPRFPQIFEEALFFRAFSKVCFWVDLEQMF